MSARVLSPDTRQRTAAFRSRLLPLKDALVGRDRAVDLVALAALCREHVLLVGPPGTAKTSLLDQFRRMLQAQYFSYLLTRFTEPAEIFGPIDVNSFQNDKVYRIVTKDKLPEAEIAFLDEIFQGGSAILNALLTIINERTFHNGVENLDVPLVTLLGATNEIPEDPLLQAFGDRFLFRFRLDYVPEDDIEDLLTVGWESEQQQIRGTAEEDAGRYELDNLTLLHRELAGIDLRGVRGPFVDILRDFRLDGVEFSDRRAVKAQKAFAAAALLEGRGRAEPEDLWPLAHLWSRQRDEESVRRILEGHGVDLARVSVLDVPTPPELRLQLRQLEVRLRAAASLEECRDIGRLLNRHLATIRKHHMAADGGRGLHDEALRLREAAVEVSRERFDQGDEGYV